MKVVIIGYGEMFSSLISGVLASGHEIVGVFRNENVMFSPLKRYLFDFFQTSQDLIFTKSLGLYDIKAESANSRKFIKEVEKLDTDIILVGSWSEKLKNDVINSVNIACINTHPSLLPKYRGPNPYIQTILNNESKSGITFHLINSRYDAGSILHQAETNISPEETGFSLKLKCCELARKEIGNVLNNIEEKIKNAKLQDENIATYQKQAEIKDLILDFKKESSLEIERRIRAFYPWQRCYIPFKDEFFEFNTYKLTEKFCEKSAGTIVCKTKNSMEIVCADNKTIEFSYLKLKRPILNIFTKFYLKYFVMINDKVT